MKKPFFLASSIQPADSATVAFRIVLHESAREGELVVHHQNTSDKSFYYGHYFPEALTDPKEGALAMADYVATCAKYNLNPIAI